MTIWKLMVEQLMPFSEKSTAMSAKPRLEDASMRSSLNNLDEFLLTKDLRIPEEFVEEEPVTARSDKDSATIALLKQKLQSSQTKTTLYREKAAVLESENSYLRKEVEARRAREQTLESEVQQLMRKQIILQDAEERVCMQLADLEAEALEQSHQQRAELSKLMCDLQQKEALITSLAAELQNLSAADKRSVSTQTDSSIQLAEAKSQLESLHRKHSVAVQFLGTAERENADLKSTIDALKAEMLSLECARQAQFNLAKKAQKELESLQRERYPIQIEAAGMLFNFALSKGIAAGCTSNHLPCLHLDG